MKPITITVGAIAVDAELDDTPCAERIWEALPIRADACTWGDEVYFEIPVAAELDDDARADMAVGELGYWPPGRAFCIFFGPTPASDCSGLPRAASPVNVIGRAVVDATVLRESQDGDSVVIEARDVAG